MRSIETTIDIAADPETVWRILTDFEHVASWNSFITGIDGHPAVGERLRVEITPPGRRATTFRPTVTAAEPAELLEWQGSLGPSGLFDGRHRFALTSTGDGATTLVHSETFRGILVPVLWRHLRDITREGFEQFNRALAERCASTVGG
jgi:hypothetical protein